MSNQERRQTKRVQLVVEVLGRMYPMGLPTVLLNISETGMGVRMNLPLPVPSRQQFEIPLDDGTTATVRGDVVRCVPDGHGEYTIGVQFVEPPGALNRIAR